MQLKEVIYFSFVLIVTELLIYMEDQKNVSKEIINVKRFFS